MGVLMGRLEHHLQGVETVVAADIRSAHLRKQLATLVLGVVAAVVWSLSGGPGTWDLKAIVPVALAAFWTQVRAIWPTVPWDLVQEWLHLPVQDPPPGPPKPGGVGVQ